MKDKKVKVDGGAGQIGFIAFICYIGALVYFIETANGFWEIVGAFFQAIVWPAFLVYEALASFGV